MPCSVGLSVWCFVNCKRKVPFAAIRLRTMTPVSPAYDSYDNNPGRLDAEKEIESKSFMHHLPYKYKLHKHKQGVNERMKKKKLAKTKFDTLILVCTLRQLKIIVFGAANTFPNCCSTSINNLLAEK